MPATAQASSSASPTASFGELALDIQVLRSAPYELEIVVPAYNEEARLPETLTALVACLRALPLRCAITVVDNGSTDDTADIVRHWVAGDVPVRLIGCSRQGKGAAVRRGMTSSTARWVGFCDADLATDLEALQAVVEELAHGAAVVIGSRRLADAQLVVPHGPVRRAGSRTFRTLVRRLVPGVTDTQCGFKFFRGDVAESLFADCRCNGFAFDVEVLARAVQAGHVVVEVPVSWSAQPGSTFSVMQHGHRVARELLVIRGLLRATLAVPAATSPVLRSRTVA